MGETSGESDWLVLCVDDLHLKEWKWLLQADVVVELVVKERGVDVGERERERERRVKGKRSQGKGSRGRVGILWAKCGSLIWGRWPLKRIRLHFLGTLLPLSVLAVLSLS